MNILDFRDLAQALSAILGIIAILGFLLEGAFNRVERFVIPCFLASQVWAAAFFIIRCLPGGWR